MYFQSTFFQREYFNIREVISDFSERDIQVIFDTNLCIYLRDIYLNPKEASIRLVKMLPDIEEFVFLINHYGVEYDYIFGLDESCRNKNDYSINIGKAAQTICAIDTLLSCGFESFKNHIRSEKEIEPIKDTSKLTSNKELYYKSDTVFRAQQSINYPALLKIFMIDNFENKSNLEKMLEFLDYNDHVIDLNCPNLSKFAYMYFGKNRNISKMLHPKKRSKEWILQGAWNCATDISIYHLANKSINNTNKIPVFVTFDAGVYELNKGTKMRVVFSDKDFVSSQLPPLVEVDLSQQNEWSIEEHHIIMARMKKMHEKSFSVDRILKANPKSIEERMYIEALRLEQLL